MTVRKRKEKNERRSDFEADAIRTAGEKGERTAGTGQGKQDARRVMAGCTGLQRQARDAGAPIRLGFVKYSKIYNCAISCLGLDAEGRAWPGLPLPPASCLALPPPDIKLGHAPSTGKMGASQDPGLEAIPVACSN